MPPFPSGPRPTSAPARFAAKFKTIFLSSPKPTPTLRSTKAVPLQVPSVASRFHPPWYCEPSVVKSISENAPKNNNEEKTEAAKSASEGDTGSHSGRLHGCGQKQRRPVSRRTIGLEL